MIFVISPLYNYLNLKRRGPWACCKEKRRRRPKGEKRLISIKINNHKRRRSSKKNIIIGYMIMLPAMFSKSLINSIEKKLSISYVVFRNIYRVLNIKISKCDCFDGNTHMYVYVVLHVDNNLVL